MLQHEIPEFPDFWDRFLSLMLLFGCGMGPYLFPGIGCITPCAFVSADGLR